MSEDRKLLEPLSTVVSGVLRLLVGVLAISVVLSLFNNDIAFWSGPGNCATADWISGSSSAADAMFSARNGAHVTAVPQYCAEHPSNYQHLLRVLGGVPTLILLIGGLILLNRLLQSAARDGVYTTQTASRLHLLGWWLLLGSVFAEVIEAGARAALLATLTDNVTFSAEAVLHTSAFPYLTVLTALGVLTFARITRVGATMREDLEGTV
ncbi:DUF2975 domain-containing protein [Streptomyces sp. NPDC048258]|uniref:DUF2975 domain-containing protein n=1 Tax=Streptomyces sp. NPDC048258 TaxID=3365527 RepID=UPI003718AF42